MWVRRASQQAAGLCRVQVGWPQHPGGRAVQCVGSQLGWHEDSAHHAGCWRPGWLRGISAIEDGLAWSVGAQEGWGGCPWRNETRLGPRAWEGQGGSPCGGGQLAGEVSSPGGCGGLSQGSQLWDKWVTDMEREKKKINPVELNWNRRYWCEFSLVIDRCKHKYKC